MSSTRDMKERVARLVQVANRLQEGDPASLRDLRRELGEIDFDDLPGQTDDWHLGILHLTRMVLSDIYGNLATDAAFGFPPKSFLHSILVEFGAFLELSLSQGPNTHDPLHHLSTAISEFYHLVAALDQAAQNYSDLKNYFSKHIAQEESDVG